MSGVEHGLASTRANCKCLCANSCSWSFRLFCRSLADVYIQPVYLWYSLDDDKTLAKVKSNMFNWSCHIPTGRKIVNDFQLGFSFMETSISNRTLAKVKSNMFNWSCHIPTGRKIVNDFQLGLALMETSISNPYTSGIQYLMMTIFSQKEKKYMFNPAPDVVPQETVRNRGPRINFKVDWSSHANKRKNSFEAIPSRLVILGSKRKNSFEAIPSGLVILWKQEEEHFCSNSKWTGHPMGARGGTFLKQFQVDWSYYGSKRKNSFEAIPRISSGNPWKQDEDLTAATPGNTLNHNINLPNSLIRYINITFIITKAIIELSQN
ncbi:hypothetical protein HUJ04_012496 [Dendroctonus ponderosae]|nr:hypothetical protein HUJ04_012496 [Dendroctonus ponderosae]